MDSDVIFFIRDPESLYSCAQIVAILKRAEAQGYPLERGSYLENMTIRQLDRLTKGFYDA